MDDEVRVDMELDELSPAQEIAARLFAIVLALLDLLGQKKFIVAIGSAVAIYSKTGDIELAAIPLALYIMAQGLADFGKEKAKVDDEALFLWRAK